MAATTATRSKQDEMGRRQDRAAARGRARGRQDGARQRAFLQLLGGNLQGADEVGTVHDMRFVFLDNDTKMLFATAYDGDWDAYIDDYLDIIDSTWDGWPGIRSPEAKDYLAKYQITAEGWFVANDLDAAAPAPGPSRGRVPGQGR